MAHPGANSSAPSCPHELSDGGARRITVALGYFDALVGRGLTQILREARDIEIIDADLDNTAIEHLVAQGAARVAILDEASVVKPSVLAGLRAAQPAVGLVVLVDSPTHACGMRLLAAGATCLSKHSSAADILIAIRITAEGRRTFTPADGPVVERRLPINAASLTPRETEVLECLSRGESHAEVAHTLQIGVETARKHAAHIYRKLGVQSKRQLVGVPIPTQIETTTY